jgi:hypothetical protein
LKHLIGVGQALWNVGGMFEGYRQVQWLMAVAGWQEPLVHWAAYAWTAVQWAVQL